MRALKKQDDETNPWGIVWKIRVDHADMAKSRTVWVLAPTAITAFNLAIGLAVLLDPTGGGLLGDDGEEENPDRVSWRKRLRMAFDRSWLETFHAESRIAWAVTWTISILRDY